MAAAAIAFWWLAFAATQRGHRVCYVTPSDFALRADDSMCVHARFAPRRKHKDHAAFFEALKKVENKTETIDIAEVDVLMLRSDPSLDAQAMPWAADIGILFGREAAKRGVLVLNDPDSLGRAINKLYFQSFPEEVRAEGVSEALAPHRTFPGNRPSNTLLLEQLTPASLGALVALYEHKVFVQGTLWNVNSFDQWGVELGKELATGLLPVVEGKESAAGHDSSTAGLVAALLKAAK